MQNVVRNNKLKKWFLSKTSSSWYGDKRFGQGAWNLSTTSSPQKCPSSCQMSSHLGFIWWARRKAYLSGCMLTMNSQLLTTTSLRHMTCPQVHYLFGQPPWKRLEINRDLYAAIVKGTASIKSANVFRKIQRVILSVILTATANINELRHCSSLAYVTCIFYQ